MNLYFASGDFGWPLGIVAILYYGIFSLVFALISVWTVKQIRGRLKKPSLTQQQSRKLFIALAMLPFLVVSIGTVILRVTADQQHKAEYSQLAKEVPFPVYTVNDNLVQDPPHTFIEKTNGVSGATYATVYTYRDFTLTETEAIKSSQPKYPCKIENGETVYLNMTSDQGKQINTCDGYVLSSGKGYYLNNLIYIENTVIRYSSNTGGNDISVQSMQKLAESLQRKAATEVSYR